METLLPALKPINLVNPLNSKPLFPSSHYFAKPAKSLTLLSCRIPSSKAFWSSFPLLQKWVSYLKPYNDPLQYKRLKEDTCRSTTSVPLDRIGDNCTSGYSESSGNSFAGSNNESFLQNGAFGMALLLSVTSNAKVKISPFVATLAGNPTFVSGLYAWLLAQSIKVFLHFVLERKWDFRIMFESGGMPSSHSALCTALTTAVALCHGVADSLFPVCLGFSLIVCTMQLVLEDMLDCKLSMKLLFYMYSLAEHVCFKLNVVSDLVLNVISECLFQGHPISQRKLKELLGHTPTQVLAGALVGFVVACICCQAV